MRLPAAQRLGQFLERGLRHLLSRVKNRSEGVELRQHIRVDIKACSDFLGLQGADRMDEHRLVNLPADPKAFSGSILIH